MLERPLPPEMLDYIVDNLCEETEALCNCCLVTKSWVPRARKHLFGDIKFTSPKVLESWKKTFPDPSNSPAYHTFALIIDCPEAITTADAEEGGWIQAFSRVVYLDMDSSVKDLNVSLVPLFGFSPILKSLRVSSAVPQGPQLFDLVLSFPLLEDLTLICRDPSLNDGDEPHIPRVDVPAPSPPFTGSLRLLQFRGLGATVRQLLDLPSGLHFQNLGFLWLREEDVWWTMELVARCSQTLEFLDVAYHLPRKPVFLLSWTRSSTSFADNSSSTSVDLSKATKLELLCFRPGSLDVEWITTALETITPEHRNLQQVFVYCDTTLGPQIRENIVERNHEQWSDLDHLLVKLWESRSTCPKVRVYSMLEEEVEMQGMIDALGQLLPEAAERGLIELCPT